MLRWNVILFVCLASSSAVTFWQTTPRGHSQSSQSPPTRDANEYKPRQVLLRPVRPITNPDIVTADKAEVADNELVIGVEINGEARAYPINQLTGPQREIINDELGDTVIAATW